MGRYGAEPPNHPVLSFQLHSEAPPTPRRPRPQTFRPRPLWLSPAHSPLKPRPRAAMAPPLLWAWPLLALAVGVAVGGACTGKRWSLTGSGALSDGAGNYSVMGDCIWVLHGETPY